LEKHLDLTFTEAKLIDLSFVIYLCTKRIEHGNCLNETDLDSVIPMADETFYEEVSLTLTYFFEGFDHQVEAQFVSIQILSTSLILNRTQQKDQKLLTAIEQTIGQFEILSITTINEKAELAAALYQHIIPASYRIKFGVPDNNPNTEKIIKEYDYVHQLVKSAIAPIENVLAVTFPPDELTYITVLFLSFLKSDLIKQKQKKQAVVVCLQGISISRLLLENLKELFPDIHFIRYMSLREFYEMDDRAFDYVFSTVHLDTEKTVFFIRPFLNEQEKSLLIYEVEKAAGTVAKKPFPIVETEKVLEIVTQYASVTEKLLLAQNLDAYFSSLRYQGTEQTRSWPVIINC
jgi:transcriptional antiterminator